MKTEKTFRSGFITIAGRPNMGKSTFLNRALGRKVAIVTPKPQTTRNRILGVCHGVNHQMIFLDTPGIHHHRSSVLGRALVTTAMQACRDVDLILYFVEARRGFLDVDRSILSKLPKRSTPVILVVNKVDQLSSEALLKRLSTLKSEDSDIPLMEIVPISALTGDNVTRLLEIVAKSLPEGPRYFPEEILTDQPERFFAAEMIREKLFLQLQEELPYTVAVEVEQFREENGILHILASVWVAREVQRGIVIGRGGARLKEIGTKARLDMESLFGIRVALKLWVSVKKNWMKKEKMIRSLGY